MNKASYRVVLALVFAIAVFAWQVTIVLGGSGDSNHYKNRVVSQLGELEWLNKISDFKVFKSSAYRNLQDNSLGYVRAVIERMTERFGQSSGDISAINLAMEDALGLLQEGRDLIAPRQEKISLDQVVAAYYGRDDLLALAALLDLYTLILQEADSYNALIGDGEAPLYLVPVASGSQNALFAPHLLLVELPSRNQVEEEFLRQRDRAKRAGALSYPQRIRALQENSLFQVLHAIKLQEKAFIGEPEI